MTNKYIKDVVRGDTFNGFEVTVSRNNVAIDITGATILMQFKKISTDTTSVFQFSTSDSSIQLTDAINGKFTVMPRIMNYPSGLYLYDMQITYLGGVVQTLFQGKFNLIQDVTR